MDEIIRDVKLYILDTFLPGENPQALTPTTPLITSGILDSLATLDLVSFLEKRYGVELEAHDVDHSKLATLEDIARMVRSKLSAKT
ncbi:MAG: acyl carrier protein [Gemmatimonadaceae bacterium]